MPALLCSWFSLIFVIGVRNILIVCSLCSPLVRFGTNAGAAPLLDAP
jgi:hypothetical protein